MKVYHFNDGKMLRDYQPLPRIGEWLEHTGLIIPGKHGLHGSVDPFDALRYASGTTLDLCELDGDIHPHGDPVDKMVGRRRKRIKSIEAEPLLREFARWCALRVVSLWSAPYFVVRYLETGDATMRKSAQSATLTKADFAPALAGAAYWAACWAASDTVAWLAAWASAGAAGDAAGAAERIAQRAKFNEMVEEAFKKQAS